MNPPVMQPVITSPYGWRTLNGQPNWHFGIDYVSGTDCDGKAGNDSRTVFAVADGVVVFDFDGYDERKRWNPQAPDSGGNFVILKHNIRGIDYFVRYFHLVRNIVANGEQVPAGWGIGTYGDVGYSYGAHLHLDVTDIWGQWGKLDPSKVLV